MGALALIAHSRRIGVIQSAREYNTQPHTRSNSEGTNVLTACSARVILISLEHNRTHNAQSCSKSTRRKSGTRLRMRTNRLLASIDLHTYTPSHQFTYPLTFPQGQAFRCPNIHSHPSSTRGLLGVKHWQSQDLMQIKSPVNSTSFKRAFREHSDRHGHIVSCRFASIHQQSRALLPQEHWSRCKLAQRKSKRSSLHSVYCYTTTLIMPPLTGAQSESACWCRRPVRAPSLQQVLCKLPKRKPLLGKCLGRTSCWYKDIRSSEATVSAAPYSQYHYWY